ncbi:MAG: protein translocase subunit SecF [Rhodospirillaceae bacterium]|nr:protein translocase subunit SecF [Rhodospirillaceae bacterium]
MPRFKIIPENPNVNFIGFRSVFFVFSALLVISSIAMFLAKGLNYGIDFTGGIMIELKTEKPNQISLLRERLSTLDLGSVELQEFGAPDDILIRIQRQDGDEDAQQKAVTSAKEAMGNIVAEYRRTELVGPKVSDELFMNGIYAVLSAMLAILVYIWFRFEWQFGLGAVIALLHDVISTIGIFSLLGLEFNLATVAAVLTIAGYSINDTVVVFDRVRENMRKYKVKPMGELLNDSANETLSRTVVTSLTTLIALLALYTLGGSVIRDFSFAMIWGVLIGTYSSISLAVPLLLYLGVTRRTADDDNDGVEQTSA